MRRDWRLSFGCWHNPKSRRKVYRHPNFLTGPAVRRSKALGLRLRQTIERHDYFPWYYCCSCRSSCFELGRSDQTSRRCDGSCCRPTTACSSITPDRSHFDMMFCFRNTKLQSIDLRNEVETRHYMHTTSPLEVFVKRVAVLSGFSSAYGP